MGLTPSNSTNFSLPFLHLSSFIHHNLNIIIEITLLPRFPEEQTLITRPPSPAKHSCKHEVEVLSKNYFHERQIQETTQNLAGWRRKRRRWRRRRRARRRGRATWLRRATWWTRLRRPSAKPSLCPCLRSSRTWSPFRCRLIEYLIVSKARGILILFCSQQRKKRSWGS